eukprot:8540463-Alexandrium_andersonii.AAC.1
MCIRDSLGRQPGARPREPGRPPAGRGGGQEGPRRRSGGLPGARPGGRWRFAALEGRPVPHRPHGP